MESVGSIIVYMIIALSIIVFSVLAVTTRKILRAATYLLFALLRRPPSISSSTTSFWVPCRLPSMPAV